MAETFAGFETPDISKYFGVSPVQGHAIIQLATGADVNALPSTELEALQKIGPARFKPGATSYDQGFGDIPYGLQHLSEHPKGSHYRGDFNISKMTLNIGKALDRLFTVRESSFKPANLARAGAVVATAGTYAGAASVISGSGLAAGASGAIATNPLDRAIQWFLSTTKIRIANIPITDGLSQHSDSLVQAYNTGVVSLGNVRAGDPNKRESSANKIARFSGGAVGTYATGSYLGQLLNSAELSLAAKGLSTATTAYGSGQIAQVVIGVLGNKIGGFVLSLLSGDIQGAIKIITSNPSQPQPVASNPSDPLLYGPSGGGGGGGGAGLGISNRNTGQTQSNTLVYVLIASILVIGGVYVLRRKIR